VTDEYIEELESRANIRETREVSWSKFELQKVMEKASRISRDIVIVLKSQNLTKCIPQDLCGYSTLVAPEEMIDNVDFLCRLKYEILKGIRFVHNYFDVFSVFEIEV
jgi:hypothetical protein